MNFEHCSPFWMKIGRSTRDIPSLYLVTVTGKLREKEQSPSSIDPPKTICDNHKWLDRASMSFNKDPGGFNGILVTMHNQPQVSEIGTMISINPAKRTTLDTVVLNMIGGSQWPSKSIVKTNTLRNESTKRSGYFCRCVCIILKGSCRLILYLCELSSSTLISEQCDVSRIPSHTNHPLSHRT